MGLLDQTTQWLDAGNRELCERNRGDVAIGIGAGLIVSETGAAEGGDFAVSCDRHLGESGRSQAPLYRLREAGIDPFHAEAGIWFRFRDLLRDAAWLRDEWPTLFANGGRDLWFCAILRYSIGKGALRHVIEETLRGVLRKRANGKTVRGFVEEMGEWATKTDLNSRVHSRFWGRQSGSKIRERVQGAKHLRRLDVAEAIGPLDGPPGGACAEETPARFPPFPPELVPSARTMKDPGATDAQREIAWQALKAYARKRLRQSRIKPAPLVMRAARWLEVRFRGPRPGDTVA